MDLEKPSYILLSPAKNEEDNLPICIESIVNQSVLPVLWLIIDDGSTDGTSEIIKEATERYEWITTIRFSGTKRDLGLHYSNICMKGFDRLKQICESRNLNYNFIGLVDSDIELNKDYFECLIFEFMNNPKLGIASGYTVSCHEGEEVLDEQPKDLPSGAARLWRKKCFYETGGYSLTCAADSVSNVKAKVSGWETIRFSKYQFKQLRLTASATGLWHGWMNIGFRNYYLGYPMYLSFMKMLKYLLKPPFYIGPAYFLGYTQGLVKKTRTLDPDVLFYYQNTRPRELKCKYIDVFNKFCKHVNK